MKLFRYLASIVFRFQCSEKPMIFTLKCVFLYYVYLDYNMAENDTIVKQYSSYTLEKFADAMLSYSSGSPHKEMAKIHSFIVPEWEGFNFHTHGGIFNILKHTLVSS